MSGVESDASQALVSLIQWESRLDGLIGAANRSDRYEGPPVFLGREAVRRVLQRCIMGEVDVLDLPRWARTVHMLERVEISEDDIDLLTQFLFEVSNPELFEPVTVEVCRRWIDLMERV
ncbi:hypothetical protein [Streptomyces xiamenensis]|uniref:hypothetical protein n=1 Tax=Streptomyces xiamenensis TaxID=408015 RepID=UPI0037D5BE28